MLWKEKLENWEKGEDILTYPENLKKQFLWETSFITKELNEIYEEEYIENDRLNSQEENESSFSEHIDKSESKYVTSFSNLSGDSKLVIPIPREGKEYTSIKLFIDNASTKQQIQFWKKVAEEVRNMLKIHNKIWVSTHGLGVAYLHVRIDTKPKYYKTQKFK